MNTTPRGIPIPDAPAQIGSALLLQLALMAAAIDGILVVPVTLSADEAAVASNALTAQSGLARNVLSGVVYNFRIVLWITAAAGEGLQLDLNGGTAVMTWFRAAYKGYDASSLALVAAVTALATEVGPQDAFSGMIEIEGSFKPSSDGTFAPRIAQTAHASGNVTVLEGSSSLVQVTA
jgi:hypothetical protein